MPKNNRIALCSVLKKRKAMSPPMGLLFLGQRLIEAGFEVRLYDITDQEIHRVAAQVSLYRPVWMGLTVFAGPGVTGVITLSAMLREQNIKIVWGGPMPTVAPEYCTDDQPVDYIVRGEAENSIVPLASALRDLEQPQVEGVISGGSSSTATAKILRLTPEETLRLEPAWELIEVKNYVNELEIGVNGIMFPLSRGCDSACGFCSACMVNPRWRPYDTVSLRRQVNYLKGNSHIDALWFSDDNLLGYTTVHRKIFEEIDMPWYGQIRADKLDKPTCGWLKSVKCRAIKLGAESGSDRILQLIRKRFTSAHILNAVENLLECDIAAMLTFIVGLPTETEKELNETLDLIDRLTTLDERVIVDMCHYLPYPGTPLWKRSLDLGFSRPARLEDWEKLELDGPSVPWVDHDAMSALVKDYNMRYFYQRVMQVSRLIKPVL